MDFYKIRGGNRLKGSVSISGSKNAALPLLAASILIKGKVTINNIPALRDVYVMFELLENIGAEIKYDSQTKIAILNTSKVSGTKAHYELVKQMRASFIIAGPLLAIFGKASISLPGGCAIGARPVDIHLNSFKKLGITAKNNAGYINLKKDGRVVKSLPDIIEIMLDFPSVGATENIIMASIYEDRTVKILNWAKEPEIYALIEFLKVAGANISISEAGEIIIQKIRSLKKNISFNNIPDRIEAGTFLLAGLITKGDILLENVDVSHLRNVIDKCADCGAEINIDDNSVRLKASSGISSLKIKTQPYPGFPTDMQAQFCSLLSVAEGSSIIEESIFENRFMHIPELVRMGADVNIENNAAFIKGVDKLTGAPVMASDLRAGAALVLAGLIAKGETVVNRIYHIDRGYEGFELKLKKLGADIERVKP